MPPRTLLSRVWRDCPEDLPCVEIVERATCDIAQAQAERQRQEHAQQNLQDWKHSVSSTSGLCRWLRCKSEVQGSAHVCLDGQVAADHVDAAKHILDFGKIFGFSIPIAIWTMAPLASSWHSKFWQTGPRGSSSSI